MTNTVISTQSDPMEPMSQSGEPDVLPGTSTIGSGVHVYGEYCSGTSVKLPIIDVQDRDHQVEGTDMRTSSRIMVREVSEGMAKSIEATSLQQASSKFSSSVGLGAEYGFFQGELEVNYDTSTQHKSSTRYMQYNEQLYFRQLLLGSTTELRESMTKAARSDFDGGMTPEELVQEYGTRYIKSLIIGARVSYGCTIDENQTVSDMDLSAATKLSYDNLVGKVEAEAKTSQGKAAVAISENAVRKARVLGGDPKLVHDILDGAYNDWRASTDRYRHVVDLHQGLRPISDLISNEQRRKDVYAAILKADGRAQLPAPPYEVPVMAYHAVNPSRWFYTISSNDRPIGYGGQNVPFSAFSKRMPETVPIYRLSASKPERFMLSSNPEERAGWSNPQLAFYAYNGPGPGRKTIYAHYNTAHSGESGWHYSTNSKVKSWTEDPSNRFFVPSH